MTGSAGIEGRGLSRAGATLRRTAAAAAVAVLAAAAAWLAGRPSGEPAERAVAAPVLAAPPPADDRGDVRRGRCASCGVVVDIQARQPAGYEFTVRMRDGSMRSSSATSRGTWHIGDAVMLMGEPAAGAK